MQILIKRSFMILVNKLFFKKLICVGLLALLLSGCCAFQKCKRNNGGNIGDDEIVYVTDDKNPYIELQILKKKGCEIILGITKDKMRLQDNFDLWLDIQKEWKLRNIENKAMIYIEIVDSKGNIMLKYNDIISFEEKYPSIGFLYRCRYKDVRSMPPLKEIIQAGTYFLNLKLKIFNKTYTFKPHKLYFYGPVVR